MKVQKKARTKEGWSDKGKGGGRRDEVNEFIQPIFDFVKISDKRELRFDLPEVFFKSKNFSNL